MIIYYSIMWARKCLLLVARGPPSAFSRRFFKSRGREKVAVVKKPRSRVHTRDSEAQHYM